MSRELVWFLAGALLLACSAEGGDSTGRGARGGPGAGAGARAGAGGGAAGDDFGNGPAGGDRPAPVGGTGSVVPQAPVGDRELMVVDECPGGVSAEVLARLEDPGVQPGGARWLYPYDRTVFPRGLAAPVLQWSDVMADAALIRVRSMLLDYRVCVSLSDAINTALPQEVWELAARQSLGKGDPLSVEVTLSSAGAAVRLPTLSLTFALAELRGAVYYNTYGSLLANQMGVVGGVVMRILPGEAEPSVFLTAPNPIAECVGCHAVSADGGRMVAELHGQPGLLESTSSSFDLDAVGSMTNPPPINGSLSRAGFAAVYPDGSRYVTTGRIEAGPIGSIPGMPPGNIPGTFGPEQSKLYDMETGTEISGSGIEPYAYMPMFSVDGTEIVFNQMDMSGGGGHSLAVMDFDRANNSFSALNVIFNDPMRFPAWPFFLPEVVRDQQELQVHHGKRVVFALGETSDFTTQEQPVGITPHVSDLYWVDVDSGKAAALDRANGIDAGSIYLPYGERDAHKNYIPTISPVAAGGYFWMFFTSKRNYGNLFVADPPELRAEAKKIWVSAIDIDAPAGTDPSHPAFFLPGQELESGNIRAFAALEPCRADGASCNAGFECCCGFCLDGQCGCKQECANVNDRCETAADCCDATARCIGGFCGFIIE